MVSDDANIGLTLDWDADKREYTERSQEACKRAGDELGLKLTPKTTWVEAAMALRSLRAPVKD